MLTSAITDSSTSMATLPRCHFLALPLGLKEHIKSKAMALIL
jgi:hypothetical protein